MRSKGGKGGNGGLAALAMAHAQGGCMRMPQHSQYAPSMAALVAAADAALSPAFERRMLLVSQLNGAARHLQGHHRNELHD